MLDVRHEPKARAYEQVHAAFEQIMGDIDDPVAGMATITTLLHHAFGFYWTGIYRDVSPTLLRVGPYQGTLGCLEISLGRGVCGTAAAERRTVVVPDVLKFPGHITCDARSRSEIVVPVFDAAGELLAVLDIDSDRANTFDAEDQAGLEQIVSWFAGVRGMTPNVV
jgi:GAF domain-containing protein